MLTRLTEAEFNRYISWAYSLATTPAHASYPSYMDGVKTREEFITRARRGIDDEEILLFTHEGSVCGWIQWYAITEEQYAQTVTCLISEHQEEALWEFSAHVAARYPGYTLDIGLDGANAATAQALAKAGFTLLDHSVNHTLFFAEYKPEEPLPGTSLLLPGEEEVFRLLHNAPDMYWSAERILANMACWQVYLHRECGKAVAALVCQADKWPEIFAIFFEGDAFRIDVYRSLMTACLNDLHAQGCHHMTCFEEDTNALAVLAQLGFRRVGEYLAYRCILEG